jgi:hypothetical protein
MRKRSGVHSQLELAGEPRPGNAPRLVARLSRLRGDGALSNLADPQSAPRVVRHSGELLAAIRDRIADLTPRMLLWNPFQVPNLDTFQNAWVITHQSVSRCGLRFFCFRRSAWKSH